MSNEEKTAAKEDQYPEVVDVGKAFPEEPDSSDDKLPGKFLGHPRYQLINNKMKYC